MGKDYIERRGIVTQEEAEVILRPYLQILFACFGDAWDWVQAILDQDPQRRTTLVTSTQAGMIYDRFIELAVASFSTDEFNKRVKTSNHGRMVRFCFDGKLAMRFKKFDAKLHSRNVRTNQQRRVYFQEFLFDGDDGGGLPTEITFGYVLDALGRTVESVYVTCPVGWSTNKWSIAVKEPPSQSLFLGATTPDAGPELPAAAAIKVNLKVSPSRAKKGGQDEQG